MIWKKVKLSDVCNIRTGKKDVNEGNSKGKYPFFTCAKEHTFSDAFSFNCEAILIAGNGAVGQTTYFNGKFEAYQRTYVLSDFKDILPKLLLLILQNKLMKHLSSIVLGNTIPYIKKSMLENFELTLPPLAEQQHIVAKLDVELNEIDKVIAFTELKLHCLNAIFEKVLHDSTQHMAVNVKLGEVCDIQGKLISPIDKPYCNELHIGAGNIESISNKLTNVLSAKEEGLISGKFPFGTDSVLYSKIRPYLRKVHLPKHSGICSADIYPLIPNTKRLDRNYLYYLLLSQNFTNYAMSGSSRAGMPKVNRKHLFGYEFCLPEIKVQKSAVKKIEAVCSNVSNFKHIETQKISQFHSLKSAILKQELQSEVS